MFATSDERRTQLAESKAKWSDLKGGLSNIQMKFEGNLSGIASDCIPLTLDFDFGIPRGYISTDAIVATIGPIKAIAGESISTEDSKPRFPWKGTRQEQAAEKQYRRERAITQARINEEKKIAVARQMELDHVVEQNKMLTDLQRQKEQLSFTPVAGVGGGTGTKGTDTLK